MICSASRATVRSPSGVTPSSPARGAASRSPNASVLTCVRRRSSRRAPSRFLVCESRPLDAHFECARQQLLISLSSFERRCSVSRKAREHFADLAVDAIVGGLALDPMPFGTLTVVGSITITVHSGTGNQLFSTSARTGPRGDERRMRRAACTAAQQVDQLHVREELWLCQLNNDVGQRWLPWHLPLRHSLVHSVSGMDTRRSAPLQLHPLPLKALRRVGHARPSLLRRQWRIPLPRLMGSQSARQCQPHRLPSNV
jgi:hypothetical protein